MKKLKINRFLQEPAHCAVAACAILTNYFDKNVNYQLTKYICRRKIVKDTSEGLDSGQIALLLNYLGFNSVTLVSSDINIFDYTWARLKRKGLLQRLKESKGKIDTDYREASNLIYKWLKKKEFNNDVIIDYNFSKYIKKSINKGNPVIVTFNWNMFFKFAKINEELKDDPIKGDYDEHAVVVYGYNKKGVYICDSHQKYYKYRLKKYRTGYYHISWENLMTVMGMGDVFLVDDYQGDF